MSGKDRSAHDKAMAARLKQEGRTPPNRWHGCGSDMTAAADKMGTLWKNRYSSTYERGMLGGVLSEKAKDVNLYLDVKEQEDQPKTYATSRIIVTKESDHKLIKMFIEAYDKLDPKRKASAPVVVSR